MPFGGAIKTETFLLYILLGECQAFNYSLLNFLKAKREMMAKTKDKSKG